MMMNMRKMILFAGIFACMALMSSGALAMSVEFQPNYNTYSTGFLSALFVGQPIDNANAGVNLWFYTNEIGRAHV